MRRAYQISQLLSNGIHFKTHGERSRKKSREWRGGMGGRGAERRDCDCDGATQLTPGRVKQYTTKDGGSEEIKQTKTFTNISTTFKKEHKQVWERGMEYGAGGGGGGEEVKTASSVYMAGGSFFCPFCSTNIPLVLLSFPYDFLLPALLPPGWHCSSLYL